MEGIGSRRRQKGLEPPLRTMFDCVYSCSKRERTVYDEYIRCHSWKTQRVDIVDLIFLRMASEVSGCKLAINNYVSF